MTLVYEPLHLEQEAEGVTELELIAIQYDGKAPVLSVSNLRSQGYWPGSTALTKNRWYVTLVPHQGLTQYEANVGIEIRYDKEGIAKALLSMENLPGSVFGSKSDRRLQERVFDELGLENVGLGRQREDKYRDQLREIAGEEETEDDEEDFFIQTRKEKLLKNSRTELQKMASELGMDEESVEASGKIELAEFIVEAEENDKEEGDFL